MSVAVGQPVQRAGGKMADGQIGHIVVDENGALAVKLDRAAENLVVPYHPSEWRPLAGARLQPMQLARIAYAADRELLFARGQYGVSEWQSVREPERIRWMQEGLPRGADAERRALYAAIKGAFAG